MIVSRREHFMFIVLDIDTITYECEQPERESGETLDDFKVKHMVTKSYLKVSN